jgi:hypothetical protein
MMEAEYRFFCKSCKYECICGIGVEKGPHYSKAAMVCLACKEAGTFILRNPGAILDPPSGTMACKRCQSSEHLLLWDGMTCPQCKMKMKAIGTNTKLERPFKYW